MAYYKCPDCEFVVQQWPLLKGHLMQRHGRDDLKEVKDASAFDQYQITTEEYARLKPPAPVQTAPPPAAETPANPPPGASPAGNPQAQKPEPITEYVGEPVARLRQVLLVNGGDPKAVETVTRVMSLSKWLWGNPYELERTILPHFSNKREWVQACISQYIRGVDLPDDLRDESPYSYGQTGGYGRQQYNFQYPNRGVQGMEGAPALSPELQELRAEIARLREERQREHEKTLLDRISELEKKLEHSGQLSPLEQKVKELEERLSGGGQAATMTIYDEKGNPMVLPYDRSYMQAIIRKQEVETEKIKTEQLLQMLGNRGDNTEKFTPLLDALKKEQAEANKKVEDLTKSLADQRIAHLEERVRAAEDLAASGTGESKGILEFAAEASENIRDGAAAAGKELKDSIEHGVDTIKEVITNRPPAPPNPNPRTPGQIADIMESENSFLASVGEK